MTPEEKAKLQQAEDDAKRHIRLELVKTLVVLVFAATKYAVKKWGKDAQQQEFIVERQSEPWLIETTKNGLL